MGIRGRAEVRPVRPSQRQADPWGEGTDAGGGKREEEEGRGAEGGVDEIPFCRPSLGLLLRISSSVHHA